MAAFSIIFEVYLIKNLSMRIGYILIFSFLSFFFVKAQTSSLCFNSTTSANVPFIGNSPLDVVEADFNNDGFKDIVTANSNSDNISVLFGNGTTFTLNATYNVGSMPNALIGGYFNADAYYDLATLSAICNSE